MHHNISNIKYLQLKEPSKYTEREKEQLETILKDALDENDDPQECRKLLSQEAKVGKRR